MASKLRIARYECILRVDEDLPDKYDESIQLLLMNGCSFARPARLINIIQLLEKNTVTRDEEKRAAVATQDVNKTWK